MAMSSDVRVDAVREAFSATPGRADQEQGGEVIFIASLPRSGSTLTDRFSPRIRKWKAPLNCRTCCRSSWTKSDACNSRFHNGGRAHSRAMACARAALSGAHRALAESGAHDYRQMPGNWLYVGAIMAMLPQARIIIARRDRLKPVSAATVIRSSNQDFTHDLLI